MRRNILLLLPVLALASCAETAMGPPPPQSRAGEASGTGISFDARDFAWSTATGSASISGVLAYRKGATRFTCQGSDVLLTPETTWSRRRMMILYGSASSAAVPVSIVRARTPSAGTGDYARFVRRTTCDDTSHFTFNGLPRGSWFVITVGKPVDAAGEPVAVTRHVETRGGAAAFVTLS